MGARATVLLYGGATENLYASTPSSLQLQQHCRLHAHREALYDECDAIDDIHRTQIVYQNCPVPQALKDAMRALPPVSDQARHHPDCCLSLSLPLVELLATHASSSPEVLSIGSGTGLLEELVNTRLATQHPQDEAHNKPGICGVEVSSAENETTNQYLPEDSVFLTPGTWSLLALAEDFSTWMFVYPREPKLVERYLHTHGTAESSLRTVLWLGPLNDWCDYKDILEKWSSQEIHELQGTEGGVVEYEMVAIATRY